MASLHEKLTSGLPWRSPWEHHRDAGVIRKTCGKSTMRGDLWAKLLGSQDGED